MITGPFVGGHTVLNSHLTAEQSTAIEFLDKPMCLTAGAGSGKTTVLVERYIALLKKGLVPSAILCVTFTNEAANELRVRIVNRLTQIEEKEDLIHSVEATPWIGTIHSVCYTLLEIYGSSIGLSGIEEIADYFELSHLFQTRYQGWFESLEDTTLSGLLEYFSPKDLRELAERTFFDHFMVREGIRKIEKSNEFEHKILRRLYHLLTPLVKELEKAIHTKGAFTFNDLETLTLKMLSTNESVRKMVQERFQSILIDEFQDTSRLQWTILQLLLDDEWKKLFVVGDPKQSIYGFRYADVSLFKEVARKIPEKNGLVQELTLNFRTQSTLLDGINRLSRSLFDGTTVPYLSMREGRTESGPDVRVFEYSLPEETLRKGAQEIELTTVIEQVHKQVETGTEPGKIALLFRNGDRLKEYQDALIAKGIPALTQTSLSLFENDEILDLCHYLRAIEDPLDDFYLGAFLRSSFIRLDLKTLSELRAKRDVPLVTQLMENPPESLKWFVALLERGETHIPTLFEELFVHTKTFPQVREGFLALMAPVLRAKSLEDCVAQLKSWESRGVTVPMEQDSAASSVRLMTVHSAKGLEFDHVILCDNLRQTPYGVPSILLHPESAPGLRYKKDGELVQTSEYESILERLRKSDLEEAKRILYVALTRARESLTLVLPRNLKTTPKGSWALLLREAMQEVIPFEGK